MNDAGQKLSIRVSAILSDTHTHTHAFYTTLIHLNMTPLSSSHSEALIKSADEYLYPGHADPLRTLPFI